MAYGKFYEIDPPRALIIGWGNRLEADGVWKLTPRAMSRLEQGKYPGVRRQQKVDEFWDLGAPLMEGNPVRPGQNSKDFNMALAEQDIQLPLKLQCPYCSSVQILDADKLEVGQSSCRIGSDSRKWRERFNKI